MMLLGESIDKFAKELGLDFPYGKNLEEYASNGNEKKIYISLSYCKI